MAASRLGRRRLQCPSGHRRRRQERPTSPL